MIILVASAPRPFAGAPIRPFALSFLAPGF
jgi:hypothetical protein